MSCPCRTTAHEPGCTFLTNTSLAPDLVAENANLRAEVERMTKMGPGHTCWATMDTAQKEALIEQRDKAYRELYAMKLQNDELRNALEEIRKLEGPGLDGSSENRSGKIARLALEGHHGNCDLFDPFGRDKPCNCQQSQKPKCEHKRVVVNTFYNEAVSVSARKCADCGEAVSPPDALKREGETDAQ